MLTVTATANEQLKKNLQEQTTDPEEAVRIVSSPSTPNRFKLVLDKEKEGDQVVKSEEGVKLLLVGSDVAPGLEGVVIDYEETGEGRGFTISRPEAGGQSQN